MMRSLMQFFFYHFYHSLAWSYDVVAAAVSLGRWKSWARAALPHLRGERVLEVGFGPGHLQVVLNQSGFQALGLDESPQMIRQARRNLTRNQLPTALMRGYAQNLPLRSGSIDCVVATFPSGYILEEQTLAEVARVLTPAGRLVIIPTAWLEGDSLVVRFIDWLFAFTGQAAEDISEAARGKLTDRLAEYGFRVGIFHETLRESVVVVVVAEKHPARNRPLFPIKVESRLWKYRLRLPKQTNMPSQRAATRSKLSSALAAGFRWCWPTGSHRDAAQKWSR